MKVTPAKNVRKIQSLAVLFVVFATMGVFNETHAANFSFSRGLRLGMSGEDVRQLQILLNTDARTQISTYGAGSPGHESAYFGRLTQSAVIRFQNIHADEVLTPNGLSTGTGFVGPSTIMALGKITSPSITGSGTPYSTSTPVYREYKQIPIASTTSIVTANLTNSNLRNLNIFLSDVDRVSSNHGATPTEIAIIKSQIVKDVSTTTDLHNAFIKLAKDRYLQSLQSLQSKSLFSDTLAHIGKILKVTFFPKSVHAQSDTSGFGGELYYAYYCTCSQNWLLDIEPLPPDYVNLLGYNTGSEIYLSNNLPYAENILGNYEEGGTCSTYIGTGCATVYQEGVITPTVGSSPL